MKLRNNFDFLRFFAASIVIVGHSFPMLGLAQPVFLGTPIATFGVVIFFSISGYLISGSWLREPSFAPFLAKRALRIFPALILVVVLSSFVFGPIFSTLSISDYFSDGYTYNYLRNIGLYIIYRLPGVFTNAPIPYAMNGSLWSLPAEFAMYLLTPLILLLPMRKTGMTVAAIVMALVSVYLSYYYAGDRPVVYATEVRAACAMGCYFAGGALLRLVKDKMRITLLRASGLFAIYVILAIFCDGHLRYLSATVAAFIVPYIVIAVAEARTIRLPDAAKYGDLSYGMYLYAFPIQQALVQYSGARIGVYGEMAAAFALTIPFAVLSWHLLEKRAMALKPKTRNAFEPAGQAVTQ